MGLNKSLENALKRREVKFLLVGVINTAVGYGSYAALVFLGLNYILANFASFFISVINSYIWNKLFTFSSKSNPVPEFARFLLVYLVSLGLGTGLLMLLIGGFHMDKYLAGAVNVALITAISWFGHNHFSFKNKVSQ